MITALIVGPIVAGFVLFAFPRQAEQASRLFGLLISVIALIGTVLAGSSAPDEMHQWLVRPFTASFHVGLGSGLGYWLVLLLNLSTICAIAAARVPRLRDFIALTLLLEGSMSGVFVARDLLLFALFWDLMLLPVYMVLVGWGSLASAAWRYLLYNVLGGLTLLLATAAFGVAFGTTDVIGHGPIPVMNQVWAWWIFGGFAFAFLVKTPVWPFHTWMPETYAELPSPMTALVSGIQSKAGLYGFIVIATALFHQQMVVAAPYISVLAMIGLVYGAVMALIKRDIKRVVAYSSLSHLGLILLAIMSGVHLAVGGAIIYMIAHGLFNVALFIVLGYVEQREGTRLIDRLGGLGRRNPRLAGAFIFAALAALGLPGLGGFTGELLILTGLSQAGYVWQVIVALLVIIAAAAYMLRLFQGVMQGPVSDDLPQRADLGILEITALIPLVAAIVALGVNPATLLQVPEALGAPTPALMTQARLPLHAHRTSLVSQKESAS
jgi:NADH-quinone oxidoreductase subunit M